MLNIALVAGANCPGVVRAIKRAGHRLDCVITSPPKKDSAEVSLWSISEAQQIDTIPATRVKDPDFGKELEARGIDVLLTVQTLFIVDAAVIAAPRIGSFNLHRGLLPRYAGRNVISWSIFNGESEHGVTLHWMLAEVDAGDIAFQERFAITSNDTGLSVSAKAMKVGTGLISQLLDVVGREPAQIPRIKQDLSTRHYYLTEVPYDGRVVWSEPAKQLANFVRACDFGPYKSPWGKPAAMLGDNPVELLEAEALSDSSSGHDPGTVMKLVDSGAIVATGSGCLKVNRVSVQQEAVDAVTVLSVGDQLKNGNAR